MDTEAQSLRTYTVRVEGSILPLKDREFVTTVLARSEEGEIENALVLATPEQEVKLHDFLRVQDVSPAADGIYVGHSGIWYAVKQGAVVESGRWAIPHEHLGWHAAPAPTASAESHGILGERDPVCGVILTPGHEAANVTYQDKTYHFCSTECREIFIGRPAQFIESPAETARAG